MPNKTEQMTLDFQRKTEFISPKEAAGLLAVSEATVRNWVKTALLSRASSSGKLMLIKEDVEALHRKIVEGGVNRLNKRANKKRSIERRSHDELLSTAIKKDWVDCADNLLYQGYSAEEIVFIIAIELIRLSRKVDIDSILSSLESGLNNQGQILLEIKNWSNELSRSQVLKKQYANSVFPKKGDTDILGSVYQHLKTAGLKSSQGSYFTPYSTTLSTLTDLLNINDIFLDPCCGSGAFLVTALRLKKEQGVKDPLSQIIGADVDGISVKIARINLLLELDQNYEGEPQVFRVDFLNPNESKSIREKVSSKGVDLIVSNPPWGAIADERDKSNYAQSYPQIKSSETFSYFIVAATAWLAKNGRLCYLLPHSVLNIKQHSDVRSYMLKHLSVNKVENLGKIFSGLITEVVRLTVTNNRADTDSMVELVDSDGSHFVKQSVINDSEAFVFSVGLNSIDSEILSIMERIKSVTLKNNASWALGVVTGDNNKFLFDSPSESLEPIYKGKEVGAYNLNPPSCFINFQPEEFQQCAKEEIFRSKEKLVYKFISSNLVFAYDNKQSLTLNSANIVIPKLDLDIKYIMACLNSAWSQFFFKKKFNTVKVLKGHIESIPIPIIESKAQEKIIAVMENIVGREVSKQELEKAVGFVDNTIIESLPLNNEQKEYILSFSLLA